MVLPTGCGTPRAVDEQVGHPALARTDGVSWQIVPSALGKYLGGPDRAGAARDGRTGGFSIADLRRLSNIRSAAWHGCQ
jgi:hypothetical protein